MRPNFLGRIRAWFINATTYEGGGQEADPMADAAARWGWLPALSGVALGGDHARRSHAGSALQQNNMSG
ncbi:hypothetical protein [Pseudarthrobacter sp. NamE5]|uniref:hypothetical protein n=1 Tax=Pseudarthrobacter sp. NamE5 TaxID=2576839 RepID=UPI00110A358B|nr:hypothetical protein [Pseudarthrobacter sp. NamE5]TLM81652.1 hypothetical protein FDW84_17570 [Pseudarthrobacter sp. NamE5]